MNMVYNARQTNNAIGINFDPKVLKFPQNSPNIRIPPFSPQTPKIPHLEKKSPKVGTLLVGHVRKESIF